MDISSLIDLPNVSVTEVTRNDRGHLFITVKTTEESVSCRCCGKKLKCKHGHDRERTLRHLPVFGKPTYIIYKPNRYICNDCQDNPTTTATPLWYKSHSDYTVEYEQFILMELINSTIVDVSLKGNVTKSAVMGILNRHIESDVNWSTINTIGVLGIDEIALKKGHKNYVTLITRRNEGEIRLLAVIKGREKAKIKGFLKSIPARLKKTVEAVCTDMCDAYVNAAKEVFKKKTIVVIDRFHVAKLYRKGLDQYRQKILKELKQRLPAIEYEKLKGAMHSLRKSDECRSKKEKEVVNILV